MRAPVPPPPTSTAAHALRDSTRPAAAGLLKLSDHQRRWLDDVAFVELEERSRIDREGSDLRRRRARAYELRMAKSATDDAAG